jgi:hypothetical protein
VPNGNGVMPRHREDHARTPAEADITMPVLPAEADITITVLPRLRPLQPVLVRAFRTESTRTLMALKAHCDTLG